MSPDLIAVEPDEPVYRLGRQPDPWAWPDWAYAEKAQVDAPLTHDSSRR